MDLIYYIQISWITQYAGKHCMKYCMHRCNSTLLYRCTVITPCEQIEDSETQILLWSSKQTGVATGSDRMSSGLPYARLLISHHTSDRHVIVLLSSRNWTDNRKRKYNREKNELQHWRGSRIKTIKPAPFRKPCKNGKRNKKVERLKNNIKTMSPKNVSSKSVQYVVKLVQHRYPDVLGSISQIAVSGVFILLDLWYLCGYYNCSIRCDVPSRMIPIILLDWMN